MPITEEHPDRGTVSAAVSNAVVGLFHEYTGRGPTRARTTITGDNILVVLADTMTKGERQLVSDGKSDLVLQIRQEFQQSMRAELTAAVERLSGRRVLAFMSANHIEPDLAAEVFLLAPREALHAAPSIDARGPDDAG